MPNNPIPQELMMRAAIEQAVLGESKGEVPVGAVICLGENIISSAHNRTEELQEPCAHAEILAIKEAAAKLNRWRLDDATLFVTLEPCTMCAGAIRSARIKTVVYGTADDKLGACGSLYNLLEDSRLGPTPRVIKGVLESECKSVLTNFFRKLRRD
jgi:tRNA(adenine34) deaminase